MTCVVLKPVYTSLTRYGRGMTKARMVRGTRQLAVSVVVTVPTLLKGGGRLMHMTRGDSRPTDLRSVSMLMLKARLVKTYSSGNSGAPSLGGAHAVGERPRKHLMDGWTGGVERFHAWGLHAVGGSCKRSDHIVPQPFLKVLRQPPK